LTFSNYCYDSIGSLTPLAILYIKRKNIVRNTLPDLADYPYRMAACCPLGRIVFAECTRRSKKQAIDSGNEERVRGGWRQESGVIR